MAGDDIFVTKTNFNRRAIQKKKREFWFNQTQPNWDC